MSQRENVVVPSDPLGAHDEVCIRSEGLSVLFVGGGVIRDSIEILKERDDAGIDRSRGGRLAFVRGHIAGDEESIISMKAKTKKDQVDWKSLQGKKRLPKNISYSPLQFASDRGWCSGKSPAEPAEVRRRAPEGIKAFRPVRKSA